ncbi:DNA sulfur modification protein DndD [Sphingomonas adhaesiva]|uniref:DNA sulfur modification protein DndD n=1 Tax=Sphingomonas adhaesiva TaxID=28212 RepID=UPI002FFCA184
MMLRAIHLENFGLYAGRQTLDLSPRGKPVVLVGGRNGAGKTTLLEAVRLALYGRRALGMRIAQSEYETHLRRRVHTGSGSDQASVASVGLDFDYTEGGIVHRYRVVRRWTIKASKATETLALEKDGAPVTSVPREEWASFLQELIPPGVSQLFFFDGEKIAEIAHDGPDEGLAEAVRGLLGIELVSRLRTDLGLYLARHSKAEDRKSADAYQQCVRDIAQVDTDTARMIEEIAELRSARDAIARTAYNVRQRFVAEGGDAANQRATLEAAHTEVTAQIARRENELKDLAGGLMPFAMAPKLVARFAETLGQAGDPGVENALALLRSRLLEWRAGGEPVRKASWKDGHWTDLEQFLASDAAVPGNAAVAWLELGERRSLLGRLEEIRDRVGPRARLLVSDLDAHTNRLRELDAELVRASGHAAGVVLDELVEAEQQLGAAEAQLKARSEELKVLEFRKAALIRDKRRLEQLQQESRDAAGRTSLAQRVGAVLQRYEDDLLDLKIAQLKTAFVKRFNHLARKDDFVADVRIDRATLDAVLIDAHGRELPKSSLSAGEKQVYAIAMLWALAHTSGRQLPMIVDTPLARLDTEHRAALVERYFPEASHQVIVLSTDTEIDDALLAKLGPKVSHSFRLNYDHKARATRVLPGYFGDEEGQGDALQQA